jgi:hypothetical protein
VITEFCGQLLTSYAYSFYSLSGSEWSPSRSGRALPRGRTPGTHCTGHWVGPRAGLDTEARGKILSSAGDRTTGSPVCSQNLH